jgi:hypothetical protein
MASPLSKPEVVLVDLVPEESTSRTVYPSVRMMSLAVGGRYDESDTDFSRTQPNLARRVGKGTPFSTSKQVDVGPRYERGKMSVVIPTSRDDRPDGLHHVHIHAHKPPPDVAD